MMYVILYFIIGAMFAGAIAEYVKCYEHNDVPMELVYGMIPLAWPLLIPVLLAMGMRKLIHFILFSKEEKIENVTNRLKGNSYEL